MTVTFLRDVDNALTTLNDRQCRAFLEIAHTKIAHELIERGLDEWRAAA